jgi:cytochrome c oxidase cbb3-type subunit I/II
LRYGDYSRLEEFIYDHPFQWGSKRTGPDLHREGGKYPNLWHYQHMQDPRSTSPGSNMPPYPWLKTHKVNFARTARKMQVLRSVGVPYSDADIQASAQNARAQGELIRNDLALNGVRIDPESELIALISYLQRLGRGPQFVPPGQAEVR